MCHREGGVEQVRNVQAQLESELLQCPFTPKLSTWSPDSRCGRAGVLPTPPVTRVSFLATFWPRATAQSKSVAMLMALGFIFSSHTVLHCLHRATHLRLVVAATSASGPAFPKWWQDLPLPRKSHSCLLQPWSLLGRGPAPPRHPRRQRGERVLNIGFRKALNPRPKRMIALPLQEAPASRGGFIGLG